MSSNYTPQDLMDLMEKFALAAVDAANKYVPVKENLIMLEDKRKIVFAGICERIDAKTTAEKERVALQTSDWTSYTDGYIQAQKDDLRASTDKENNKMLYELYRSMLSARKTEMNTIDRQ